MSMNNKLRKAYTSILTVVASSDVCVLLKMQPAELNNRSHTELQTSDTFVSDG